MLWESFSGTQINAGKVRIKNFRTEKDKAGKTAKMLKGTQINAEKSD